MNTTGSEWLRTSLTVACFLVVSTVCGQEVHVVARPANASLEAPVDYAAIIQFPASTQRIHAASSAPASRLSGGAVVAEEVEMAEVARPAEMASGLSSGPSSVVEVELAEATQPASAVAGDQSRFFDPSLNAAKTLRLPEGEADSEEDPFVEEIRRRTGRPAGSQGLRSSRQIERWDIPEPWSLGSAEVKWPDWLFEGTDFYVQEAPAYAQIASLPLFYVHPPMETELKRKIKKLVRKKLFREVRRHTKRRWRKLFKQSATMRFSTYEETLAKINHIGKEDDRVDEFNDDYRINEAKDHIFRREGRNGEADIPLFTWGPLTVTDGGELRFDMGTAADNEEVVVEAVEVGGKKPKPLFSGKEYKLNTSLRLSINDDYTGGENFVPFLSTYGVDVQVEWLSDILGREMVGAEFEVEFDDDGDVAAFFNFVIKSR